MELNRKLSHKQSLLLMKMHVTFLSEQQISLLDLEVQLMRQMKMTLSFLIVKMTIMMTQQVIEAQDQSVS